MCCVTHNSWLIQASVTVLRPNTCCCFYSPECYLYCSPFCVGFLLNARARTQISSQKEKKYTHKHLLKNTLDPRTSPQTGCRGAKLSSGDVGAYKSPGSPPSSLSRTPPSPPTPNMVGRAGCQYGPVHSSVPAFFPVPSREKEGGEGDRRGGRQARRETGGEGDRRGCRSITRHPA